MPPIANEPATQTEMLAGRGVSGSHKTGGGVLDEEEPAGGGGRNCVQIDDYGPMGEERTGPESPCTAAGSELKATV
jgi:hypothetical protein